MSSAIRLLHSAPFSIPDDRGYYGRCGNCFSPGPEQPCGLFRDIWACLENSYVASNIPERSTLFVQGNEANQLHLISSGYLKLTMRDEGREFVLRIAGPKAILGLDEALSFGRFEYSAVALTPVYVRSISLSDFLAFVETSKAFEARALRCVARQYRLLFRDFSRTHRAEQVSTRLGRLLVELGEQIGERTSGGAVRFPFHLTHEELGTMMRTTRETITRNLTLFRRNGWISMEDEVLTICQPKELIAC
jgi:CRP/FNR family transcriptional regulator, cyclic AMP receptor protein